MASMEGYAELFARGRGPVLVFVVLASLLSVFGLTRLTIDDVPREIFADDDEDFRRLLSIYEDFGADDNDAFLVVEAEDVLRPSAFRRLEQVAATAAEIEGVEAVLWAGAIPVFRGGSLPRSFTALVASDPEGARDVARTHPLIGRRLIAEDGRTALVIVRLSGELLAIGDIEPPVVALRELAARQAGEPDVRVRVTGIPPIRVDIFRIIRSEQTRFFLIGGVLCTLTALFLFRNVGAVVATTVPPLFGALWAYGLLGFLGAKLDILSSVLSMLVIVIALTDCIHLMIDVRLSRAKGIGRVEASAEAIRHLGVPCALTSLTTAVGFGSLGLASVPAIKHFGLLAGASVVMAFLAVITVMPLIASCFARVGASRETPPEEAGRFWSTLPGRLVAGSMRRPRTITLAGVLATLGLFALSLQLEPENRLTEALPRDDAYDALMACEEAFGGILPTYVLVDWGRERTIDSPEVIEVVARVSDLLGGMKPLGRPLSFLDLLDSVPGGRARPTATLSLLPDGAERPLLRADLGRALVVAPVPDEGSEVLLPLFDRIQSGLRALEERHAGFELHLTGTDFVARSNVNRMIDDLARSLAFAALVIFGVISLEFRSLRLGAISVLPNLFPLVLVGGVLRLLGMPLQMGTAVLFTVLLGLAVDDTIHFLSRYRRERRAARAAGRDPDGIETLETTYLAVGRAILVTTIVLTVAFGTVALSTVPTNRAFATLACLGLLGALAGDLLLLPAALRRQSLSSTFAGMERRDGRRGGEGGGK